MGGGIEGELETLCRACGLCCDGSLFGAVTLEHDERAAARRLRLRILPRGTAFEQPCAALSPAQDHTCAVYVDRPRACRTFTCRLYERHRREGGPLEQRLQAVRTVRDFLRRLETTSDDDARRAVASELTARIEDFARST